MPTTPSTHTTASSAVLLVWLIYRQLDRRCGREILCSDFGVIWGHEAVHDSDSDGPGLLDSRWFQSQPSRSVLEPFGPGSPAP